MASLQEYENNEGQLETLKNCIEELSILLEFQKDTLTVEEKNKIFDFIFYSNLVVVCNKMGKLAYSISQ